jgi:hypothetical protein
MVHVCVQNKIKAISVIFLIISMNNFALMYIFFQNIVHVVKMTFVGYERTGISKYIHT